MQYLQIPNNHNDEIETHQKEQHTTYTDRKHYVGHNERTIPPLSWIKDQKHTSEKKNIGITRVHDDTHVSLCYLCYRWYGGTVVR